MQTNKLFPTLSLCCLLLALASIGARAQTITTWIGPATGGEWNTPSSWNVGVPGQATNAVVMTPATIAYNTPMLAPSIGGLLLSNVAVLNLNAAGFVVSSGVSTPSTAVGAANSSGTLNVNNGGALTVSNSGPLYISTNGVVVVNAGGSLLVTNSLASDGVLLGDNKRYAAATSLATLRVEGGTASIDQRVTIAGSTTATSAGGSQIIVNSGTLNLWSGGRINNTTDDGSCRVLINGGTANLGSFNVGKSSPNPGAGLVISNGIVNATTIQIGVANSRAYGAIYAGTLTNTGLFTVSDTTTAATTGDRRSHFVMLGGTVVSTTPEGIIVGDQANGGAAASSVIGGFLDLSGGTLFAKGITLVKDNTIANAYGTLNLSGTATVYLDSVGLVGNTGAGGSGYFINVSGGTLGATADYPITGDVKVNAGTTTIQCADASNNPFNITASGIWSSTGTLKKTGGGKLTMNGANTYSGPTLINGGAFILGSSATLASTLITVGPGTILDVSAVPAFTLNAAQVLAGSGIVTGVVTVASGATINPGSNTLTGLLILTNDLTATGGALIHLDIPNGPASPNNDSIIVGGTLTASGVNTIDVSGASGTGNYKLIKYGTLSGTIANFTLTGATGTLSNSVPDGTIYLVVAATIRGPTNVVWIGNLVNTNWDTEASTNWLNNGALDFFVPGDNARFDNTGLANPLVNIPGTVTPATTTVNSTGNYTLAGPGLIGGIGGLTKTNTGTLLVLTTNSYTGVTTINGGTLEAQQLANSGLPSAIGAATGDPANLVISNGVFRYSGPAASTDRGATLASDSSAIDVSVNGNLTLNGTLVGAGGLTKVGNGTLVLTGANSYTGSTVLSNGTVQIGAASGLVNTPVVFDGGTLSLNVSGQPAFTNPLNITNGGTLISAGGNNNIIQGPWAGPGTLNLSLASGTFTINANMTTNFTGTILVSDASTATFRFNAGGSAGGAQQSTGSPTATFDLGNSTVALVNRNGGGDSFGQYDLGALSGGVGTFLRGSANSGSSASTYHIGAKNLNTTFAGTITTGTGGSGAAVNILKVGTGVLTLLGQNTYNGTTTISNGVLALAFNPTNSADGSIGSSSQINITSGTFLDVSARSDGTLPLGSGQILRGRGTLNGILNTSSGGLVSPGGGTGGNTGTLTVTNSINLNGGTAWMKLNRGNTPNSDRLVSSLSSITYGGTLVLTNIGANLQVGDTFTLFSGGGLSGGTFSTIIQPNYFTLDTTQLGVNGTVTVTAILPPPAFAATDFSQLNINSTVTLNATGAPNGPVIVFTSTNLAPPLTGWTPIATNSFDNSGTLSLPVTVDPNAPQSYYLLQAF